MAQRYSDTLRRRDMRRRLITVANTASECQYTRGLLWYRNACNVAETLSEESGLSLEVCAGMLAVLSPAVSWPVTVQSARRILQHGERAIVAGYGPNKTKALRLLNGEPAADVVTGKKVTAFWRAILCAGECRDVPVDRHAARAAFGAVSPDEVQKRLGRAGVSETIARAYREATPEGLHPATFQAIVWVVYRENVLGLEPW